MRGGVNGRLEDQWSALGTGLGVGGRSHLLATGVNPQVTTINFRPTAYVAGLSYAF